MAKYDRLTEEFYYEKKKNNKIIDQIENELQEVSSLVKIHLK